MKIEQLEDAERSAANDIMKLLAGLTVKEAETVLKAVAANLKECAVIDIER